MKQLEKGDRVRLSEAAKLAGIQRWGDQGREGTVLGITEWIKVHWDGLGPRTVYYYHPAYIVRSPQHAEDGDGQ